MPRDAQQPEVTTVEEANTASSVVVTQEGEEFKTTGKTLVRSKTGYRFASGDKSLPVITSEGVHLSAAQAKQVVEEAVPYGGLVYIDSKEE